MKQEEKQLLLVDLSARLPYKIKFNIDSSDVITSFPRILEEINSNGWITCEDMYLEIEDVKPYLFPLSSMTKEQLLELASISFENSIDSSIKTLDWLNKNHFDYRNLIDKNLAIDCTNLNIY